VTRPSRSTNEGAAEQTAAARPSLCDADRSPCRGDSQGDRLFTGRCFAAELPAWRRARGGCGAAPAWKTLPRLGEQVPGRERVRRHVRQPVQGACAAILHAGAGHAADHVRPHPPDTLGSVPVRFADSLLAPHSC